ncbi:MAG: hypothetical protein QG635_760, partial [Bacteroidota bacterium]|nr:hypothetical protein [Bacteroidota bacterium]
MINLIYWRVMIAFRAALFVIMIFIFSCIHLISQIFIDSVKEDLNRNLSYRFDISGSQIYSPREGYKAIIPDYLKYQNNRSQSGYLKISPDEIQDSPLYHGAGYFDLGLKIAGYGFSGKFNLIAEHRGMSYGIYDTKNMIVYPKMNLSFD